MMGKVRGALFNALHSIDSFDIKRANVLDVFSGSGSIGLEALSRGAKRATFVDASSDCIRTCLSNAEACGFKDRALGVCARAEDFLADPVRFGIQNSFHLVCLTPPYEEVNYPDLLALIGKCSMIAENCVFVIEYPKEMKSLPYIINGRLFGIRNRRFGRTMLAMYAFSPSQDFPFHPDEFSSIT